RRGFSSLFFFSSRRRHTRSTRDWSSDVCSSDLLPAGVHRDAVSDRPRWTTDRLSAAGVESVAAGLALRGRRSAAAAAQLTETHRSEERRVGKECRTQWRAAEVKEKGGERTE